MEKPDTPRSNKYIKKRQPNNYRAGVNWLFVKSWGEIARNHPPRLGLSPNDLSFENLLSAISSKERVLGINRLYQDMVVKNCAN